jgi:hypothetical protein
MSSAKTIMKPGVDTLARRLKFAIQHIGFTVVFNLQTDRSAQ